MVCHRCYCFVIDIFVPFSFILWNWNDDMRSHSTQDKAIASVDNYYGSTLQYTYYFIIVIMCRVCLVNDVIMKYIVFNVEFSRVLGQKVFHRRDLYQKILQFIFHSLKRLQHGIISGLAHDKKNSQIKYGSSERGRRRENENYDLREWLSDCWCVFQQWLEYEMYDFVQR